MNVALCKILGFTHEQVCTDMKAVSELLAPDHRNMLGFIHMAMTQLPVACAEMNLNLVTKFGKTVVMRANISTVRNMPEGRVSFIVCVLTPLKGPSK